MCLVLTFLTLCAGLNTKSGYTTLEREELQFFRDRLLREAGSGNDNQAGIRKAYRRIAQRLNRNLFGSRTKLDFQLKILNLAKDALVGGGHSIFDREPSVDMEAGYELPEGRRASDDLRRQFMEWQIHAVEEGISYAPDPESAVPRAAFDAEMENATFASQWNVFSAPENVRRLDVT
eukprot:GEMP01099395.1.p1 GENE.GEMP01099395.1~~GEMP01099395.1.p1  ORF type:complete len:189 (+),score=42.45 GEMP01099395.1:37-567(+)